jgi:pimeloyl-ACP methyl ester carboxylesterase
MTDTEVVYGIVAEFNDPTTFVEAARKVKEEGYRRFEAYSPYPIKDLFKIVPGRNPVPPIVFISGLIGSAIAWSMQYYIAAIDYPINVGGRPLYSWPAFVPILFELTVLLAAFGAFFGTLALCGFPRLHFPLFNLAEFAKVSSDRFFLCVESSDPLYDSKRTARFLQELEPIGVWPVEAP